jgi:pilus assembly protein Flp/PilA
MNNLFLRSFLKLKNLVSHEEGQDLAEYALVVTIIAFAAVASTRVLYTGIANMFENLATAIEGV